MCPADFNGLMRVCIDQNIGLKIIDGLKVPINLLRLSARVMQTQYSLVTARRNSFDGENRVTAIHDALTAEWIERGMRGAHAQELREACKDTMSE